MPAPRKAIFWLIGILAVLACLAAVPVAVVETRCTASASRTAEPDVGFAISAPGYRRPEGGSYLSFPRWYVVYAYDDLAGVAREASESSFDYVASIGGFWTSLCDTIATAGAIGPVTLEQRVANYVIGVSFSAEMAFKGLYERTVGALAVLVRGREPTPEDAFALRQLDDYAAFLRGSRWYDYPFGTELARFWGETPLTGGNPVRKIERRLALTLEYAAKAICAAVTGVFAGHAPAGERIMSIVDGLDDTDVANDERIRKLAALDGGYVLIETPRHQAFTDIVRELAARGRNFVEIAGNRRILVTILVPAQAPVPSGADEIFSMTVQSRPGWRRLGLAIEAAQLTRLIAAVEGQRAVFEHAYDY